MQANTWKLKLARFIQVIKGFFLVVVVGGGGVGVFGFVLCVFFFLQRG